MSHEPRKYEWELSMISVNVVFQRRGTTKTEECGVAVNRNATMKEFKLHLKASKSITGTVSLNGEELNDPNATLSNCGVTGGVQVSVVSYTPRRALTHSIPVKVPDKGSPIMVKISPHTKVSELAHMVQDECWMPVEEQHWYKKGKILRMSQWGDSSALEHYKQHMSKEPLVVKWSPKVQVQRDKPVHHRGDVHGPTLADKQRNARPGTPRREILPNTAISRDGLVELSKEMVDWKCYANQLNVSLAKQREIKSDNPEFSEQKFKLLWTWKQQQGREATWKAFMSACIELNDHHLRDVAIRLSHVPKMSSASYRVPTSAEEP